MCFLSSKSGMKEADEETWAAPRQAVPRPKAPGLHPAEAHYAQSIDNVQDSSLYLTEGSKKMRQLHLPANRGVGCSLESLIQPMLIYNLLRDVCHHRGCPEKPGFTITCVSHCWLLRTTEELSAHKGSILPPALRHCPPQQDFLKPELQHPQSSCRKKLRAVRRICPWFYHT